MRDNFFDWENHYHDILCHHFDKFNIFLIENGAEATDYETFSRYMYTNTLKTLHPYLDKLLAPIW